MRNKCLINCITLILMFILAATGYASPMDSLKNPINTAISILNDPVYKAEGKKGIQREKLWDTVKTIFDFNEVSKRALARNWKKFSPDEKKAFADVFSEFLGNTYIDRIQGQYHNEKIVFESQELLNEKKAIVRTKIVRETVEIPVLYRMKLSNGEWKVYDVIVEGISLIKNYRVQFHKILKKETPLQLIQRLDKKLATQKQKMSKT